MLRSLTAVVVSLSLVFGSAASAFAAPTVPNSQADVVQPATAQAVASDTKESPLPAAGAAGIKKAQALALDDAWLGVGLVVGIALVAFLLMHDDDDDDDETPSTPGT